MTIKFSLRFCLLLLFMHMAAAITVYATAVPLAFKLTAILLVLLSLFYYLARDVFISFSASWHEIVLEQDSVRVTVRDGSSFNGQVTNTTIVSPYCIVFRVGQSRRHLLASRAIFPDSLSPGEFRELCVGLKFA
jgi:hypothetical protein